MKIASLLRMAVCGYTKFKYAKTKAKSPIRSGWLMRFSYFICCIKMTCLLSNSSHHHMSQIGLFAFALARLVCIYANYYGRAFCFRLGTVFCILTINNENWQSIMVLILCFLWQQYSLLTFVSFINDVIINVLICGLHDKR